MAGQDVAGMKRKGAPNAAPKAKKAKKSDDVAAPKAAKAAKPAAATKSAAAAVDATAAESKPANCKSPRKQAADEVADAATTEPVKETAKPAKGKKKSKAATNGDAPEPAAEVVVEVKAQAPKKKAKAAKDGAAPEPAAEVVVEVKTQAKPKKQARKGKTVVVADNIVVEAPKATTEKAKKGKKGKSAETVPAPVEEDVMAGAEDEAPPTKSKKAKGKGSKKQAEPVEEVADVEVASEAEGEGDEDDQTAALLAGFESDEDEQDPDEDDKFANDAKVPTLSKKQKTALEKAATGPKANQPGVIYVGRIPRGFFEPQMKQYFNQFGRVLRLRLSRNKTTGASKHYAFVEFASGEVADIVARTMDSYLLFGHILKCKLVPADQVRPDLFLGAGQRFKIDPRNKKAGLEMERGVERAQWQKRVEHENKRRAGKSKYLKETLGYEIEAPNLRSVDDVPMQDAGLENGDAQEQLADAPAEEAPAAEAPEDVATLIEEQPKSKKQRKGAAKKTKAEVAIVEPEPAVEPETVVVVKAIVETNTPAPASKAKTNKKRKSDVAVNTEVPTEDVTVVDKLQRKMKKKARTSAPQA